MKEKSYINLLSNHASLVRIIGTESLRKPNTQYALNNCFNKRDRRKGKASASNADTTLTGVIQFYFTFVVTT